MTDAPGGGTPALRRLEVAAALRKHRKAARLSTAQVLDAVSFSASKLSRIETGSRPVQTADLATLCQLYGVDVSEQARLRQLADESRQPSTWRTYEAEIDPEYAELEEAANSIDDYKTTIISALLQVPDYTRALMRGLYPNTPEDLIEQHVEVRAIRQREMLESPSKIRASFVMDEAALHRRVGGIFVMREQLLHLVELTERTTKIDLRVIPFEAGPHPGMDSLFMILSFRQAVRDRVYIDGLSGPMYRVESEEIRRYRQTFERLQEIAAPPDETRKRISRLAESL